MFPGCVGRRVVSFFFVCDNSGLSSKMNEKEGSKSIKSVECARRELRFDITKEQSSSERQ